MHTKDTGSQNKCSRYWATLVKEVLHSKHQQTCEEICTYIVLIKNPKVELADWEWDGMCLRVGKKGEASLSALTAPPSPMLSSKSSLPSYFIALNCFLLFLLFSTAGALVVITVSGVSTPLHSTPLHSIHPVPHFSPKPHKAIKPIPMVFNGVY